MAALHFGTRSVQATVTVDVTQAPYSATPNDASDDSAAIQAANDYVTANGGGTVYFPAGTYKAKGILQDSNVEFDGDGRDSSTIEHAEATPSTRLVQGRQCSTVDCTTGGTALTGTIVAGTNSLTVNNSSKVDVGELVAVRAAGTTSTDQKTELALSASSSATTLWVNDVSAFSLVTSNRYLKLDNEIVSYSGIDATLKRFTGVTRGLYGTSQVSHSGGAPIRQALRFVAQVAAKSLTTLTLDGNAAFSVNSAPVTVGSANLGIHELTIDGGPDASSQLDAWPLYYGLANDVSVIDSRIKNGANGGMRLADGTRGSLIQGNEFIDNGGTSLSPAPAPAHLWLFQGVNGVTVDDNDFSGRIRWAIAVDDRSVTSTEFNMPSNNNIVQNNSITYPADSAYQRNGIIVQGSNGNTLTNNAVSESSLQSDSLGIVVGPGGQGVPSDLQAASNSASANTFTNLQVGIRSDGNGTGNTYSSHSFSNVTTQCDKHNPNDHYTSNGTGCPDS
jgi:hypothetical protein